MKLYHNKRHIKTIPSYYQDVEDIPELLDDFDHLRLSDSERRALDERLLNSKVSRFLKDKKSNPHLNRFLHDTHPVKVLRVVTRDANYHVLKMANGHELKCTADIYRSSPIKETVKRLY